MTDFDVGVSFFTFIFIVATVVSARVVCDVTEKVWIRLAFSIIFLVCFGLSAIGIGWTMSRFLPIGA